MNFILLYKNNILESLDEARDQNIFFSKKKKK